MDQEVPAPEFYVPLEKFANVVTGFSAISAFVTSIFILAFKLMKRNLPKYPAAIFFSSIITYHAFKVVQSLTSKRRSDIKTIYKFLFSPDLHMLIIAFLFSYLQYINWFYVLDYCIIICIDAFGFIVGFIAPVLKLENKVIDECKNLSNLSIMQTISVFIEIIVLVCILKRAMQKKKKLYWTLFFLYMIFVNLSSFAASDFFGKIWMKINIKLRIYITNKSGFLVNVLESVLDFISTITKMNRDYTQKRDYKAHID